MLKDYVQLIDLLSLIRVDGCCVSNQIFVFCRMKFNYLENFVELRLYFIVFSFFIY